MGETEQLSPEEIAESLTIARTLIEHGIPVLAAPPCPAARGGSCNRDGHAAGRVEYHLPSKWQLTVPSAVWLERWQPGWALGLVGGHLADVLDVDPRHGGDASARELRAAGHWPRTFGRQLTPSGGEHRLISPTGEARDAGFLPGLDLQGGRPDGTGRGLAWIAPTVKRSKAEEHGGALRPYRWVEAPDLELLADFAGTDDSVDGIRLRVMAHRARSSAATSTVSAPGVTSQLFGPTPGSAAASAREFTPGEARAYCAPVLERLKAARVGEIEERCNAAAATLSHFVPEILTAEGALDVLREALASTAYDPRHPASTWTVDKFRPVLDGRRPLADNWKATVRTEIVDASTVAMGQASEASAPADAVEALLAEMLTLEEVRERPAPRPLIKGLLNLNSLAWLIGPPGCRKSFVALDMAAHVAAGRTWQGFPVTQGRVIIVAAEGAGGLSKRVRAWEMTHGALPAGVHVLPRPVQAGDGAAWSVLVAACGRLLAGEPGLVVLDTQARVTVGMEENDATDMGHYIEAVEAIKRTTEACVMSIHHTGRKGGDARGSSAIDGAQDTELKVVKGDGLIGELLTEKQKDLDERASVPLAFVSVMVGVDEDGDPITSLALSADPFTAASAASTPVIADVGQESTVTEPGDWTDAFVPPYAVTQRRILQVLRDVAGEVGRTEAQVRALVASRWHGGKCGRGAGRLDVQGYSKAWTAVREVRGQGGDLLVVPGSAGGASFILNPDLGSDDSSNVK